MKKGTDTIMTSPKREVPKTSTKRSAALRSMSDRNYTFFFFFFFGGGGGFIAIKRGGRATRNLPHAKMLLVSIRFSPAG